MATEIKGKATASVITVDRVSPTQGKLAIDDRFAYLDEHELGEVIEALQRVQHKIRGERMRERGRREERGPSWLTKIEDLKPGDPCEFHYPARSEWLPGVVVVNGGSGYWEVRGPAGTVCKGLYIEMVRLPGQTEAWPR